MNCLPVCLPKSPACRALFQEDVQKPSTQTFYTSATSSFQRQLPSTFDQNPVYQALETTSESYFPGSSYPCLNPEVPAGPLPSIDTIFSDKSANCPFSYPNTYSNNPVNYFNTIANYYYHPTNIIANNQAISGYYERNSGLH